MKTPFVRVINRNRRKVYRAVQAKLDSLLSIMKALRITPEVEELIEPHHLGYVYIQERTLYRNQLASFRALQSHRLDIRCTRCVLRLDEKIIRIKPGRMGIEEATSAVRMALAEMTGSPNPEASRNLATCIMAWWAQQTGQKRRLTT